MGYLNVPANGWPQIKDLEKLDKLAKKVGNLPTFTSDDRVFLEKLPALPTEEGKTVLTAVTDNQGNTDLTYATPEVDGGDIAPVFDDTATYSAGDLVYYDGVLYKFDADHAAGTWDPTEATQTSVAAEFKQLKNTLNKQSYSVTNQSKYISILRYIKGNIDFTKITDTSYIKVSYSNSDRYDIYNLKRKGEKVVYSFAQGASNVLRVWEASIFNNATDNPTLYLYEFMGGGNSITDITNADCTGQTWTLYY